MDFIKTLCKSSRDLRKPPVDSSTSRRVVYTCDSEKQPSSTSKHSLVSIVASNASSTTSDQVVTTTVSKSEASGNSNRTGDRISGLVGTSIMASKIVSSTVSTSSLTLRPQGKRRRSSKDAESSAANEISSHVSGKPVLINDPDKERILKYQVCFLQQHFLKFP
ncbi:unnamed protein product [Protopolystoma xenopodis]|uniref:Uncharacterized protein n=1 Tax=Protopolystoma xenopodis TaxID=117903 RepID=A0A3S5AUM8_9PLAT|nr:unnamed protein product [Protopolystoma xenopodis]